MIGQKKPAFLEFADVSGGVNSIENPVRIEQNQVQPTTIGCILKKSGFVKYPGAIGLSATDTFSDYLRMISIYRQYDTTETLVALSAGHLYFVSLLDGSLTDKYTMGTASNPGSSCESYGKMFVCNGSSVVKIEKNVVYPVGITPPAGVTAAASVGVGLPDGNYDVIVGYARRISGVDVLYSAGQTIGNVTLGGGNNQITVSNFANSADAQVGNKVLWLESPGEVIHYYFYGTGNNTTTTFIVSGTGTKNVSNVYETFALDNGLPPSGATYMYAFANRLWLIKDNGIYYSNKAFSEYDLEIFAAANFILTPYKLTGIFSVETDLYFNTESGILQMVNADPSTVLYLTEPRWHFVEMNTVDRWNNGVIGLTNDGVRYFAGNKFSNYDLSQNIKTLIDSAIAKTSNFPACGYVYRRPLRCEYHLMWQDSSVSASVNNRHAILNLDTALPASSPSRIYSADAQSNYDFAWELQPVSGNFATVSRNTNTAYIGQTHASASKIYSETESDDMLNYLYGIDGVLITIPTPYQLKFTSRFMLPGLNALCWFEKFRMLLSNNAELQISFILPDQSQDGGGHSDFYDIPAPFGGAAKYDSSKYDQSYYPIEQSFVFVGKFADNFSGRMIGIEITQIENDPNLSVMTTQLQFMIETGNFL